MSALTIQNTPPNEGASKALAIIDGDLKVLTDAERVDYYFSLCEGFGLDPRTKPLEYMNFKGKVVLYMTAGGAQQVAAKNDVSTRIVREGVVNGCIKFTAEARTKDGRSTESSALIHIEGLKGDAYCNAVMKCETKAKRRAILSLCGMAVMDESEIETTPAIRIDANPLTGEIASSDDYDVDALLEEHTLRQDLKAEIIGIMKQLFGDIPLPKAAFEQVTGTTWEVTPRTFMASATIEQLTELRDKALRRLQSVPASATGEGGEDVTE